MTGWQPGHPLVLETDRFRLRSMGPTDITEEYVAWWNDPEIRESFNRNTPKWTRQDAVRHIETFNNKDKFHLGIYDRANGKMIGFMALFADFRHGTGSMNFCLGDRNWWGKDAFVEVKEKALDFMFDTLNLTKVESESKGRNLRSFYTNKVLGVKPEGVLRKQAIGPNGQRIDIYLFGITKDEWHQRRAGR